MTLAASVPHPRFRLPVLGDVVRMSPTAPMQSLVRDARRLGPLFVRRLLGADIVVAAGVDVVTELADESRFEKAVAGPVEDFRELTADGLFTAYNGDERWHAAHEILSPGFTGYHDTLADSCLRVLDRWGPVARFDAFEEMRRITVDVIGRCGLGHDFEAYRRDDEHPFIAGWRRCARHWQLRTFVPMLDRLPGGGDTSRRSPGCARSSTGWSPPASTTRWGRRDRLSLRVDPGAQQPARHRHRRHRGKLTLAVRLGPARTRRAYPPPRDRRRPDPATARHRDDHAGVVGTAADRRPAHPLTARPSRHRSHGARKGRTARWRACRRSSRTRWRAGSRTGNALLCRCS